MNLKRKEQRDITLGEAKQSVKSLQTHTLKTMLEQDKLRKEREELEQIQKRALVQRKYDYDKFIKQAHMPVVDQAKVEEIKERIQNIKHPVKQRYCITPGMSVS